MVLHRTICIISSPHIFPTYPFHFSLIDHSSKFVLGLISLPWVILQVFPIRRNLDRFSLFFWICNEAICSFQQHHPTLCIWIPVVSESVLTFWLMLSVFAQTNATSANVTANIWRYHDLHDMSFNWQTVPINPLHPTRPHTWYHTHESQSSPSKVHVLTPEDISLAVMCQFEHG
jgi:hypothetical protein